MTDDTSTVYGDRETASFRRIPPQLKREIDQFARERNYPIGLAARVLLTYSIYEFQQGRLHLAPQLTQSGWTLYPETTHDHSSKRRYRTTTFRGVPEWIFQKLAEIAEDVPYGPRLTIKVDKGDVTRAFFEHALAAYEKSPAALPAGEELIASKTDDCSGRVV
jgi:hypothetical protein